MDTCFINDSRLLFMHTGVQRNFYIRWYPCRLTVTSPRTTYLPWVPPYFHSFEMINFIECKTNLYKILCNVLFFKFYCALWLYECWKLKFTPGYNVDQSLSFCAVFCQPLFRFTPSSHTTSIHISRSVVTVWYDITWYTCMIR